MAIFVCPEAQWVTADIFDTDEQGRIIEHWDVIAEYKWPTVSGRTMVDGPTEIEDLDQTDANKAVVQGFVDNVLMAMTGRWLLSIAANTAPIAAAKRLNQQN